MANNDTTRASAPLTARAKAKRTAEIRRLLEAERAARRPRLEAHDPRNVPMATRGELEALQDAGSAERRLADAGTTALMAYAGATSAPAAAASVVPGALKLRRDLEEQGVEGLVDPANLMMLAAIKSGAPLPKMLKNPRTNGVMYHGTKDPAGLSWDQILPPKRTGAQATDGRASDLNMDKIFGTRSLEEATGYAGKDGSVLLVAPKNAQRHRVRHRDSDKFGEIYKADSGTVIGGIPVKRLGDPVPEALAYQLKLYEMSTRQDAKGGESASSLELPVPKVPAELPKLQDAPIPVEPPTMEQIERMEYLAGPGWNTDEAYALRLRDAVDAAIPFIKEFERFRGKAYWDKDGKKWTVGHGLTQISDPVTGKMRDVVEGDTITEETSDELVHRIALSRAASLFKDVPWARNLGVGALAAAIDLAYNAGAGIFNTENSPNLNEEMESADMDFDSLLWAALPSYYKSGGKPLDGLLNRREAAVSHFRDGMLIADARRKAEAARLAEKKAKAARAKGATGIRQDAKGGETAAPDTNKYRDMSVYDKLKLADERLKKFEGTDKYDAFKQRVDAMHAKYEPMLERERRFIEEIQPARLVGDDVKSIRWDYTKNTLRASYDDFSPGGLGELSLRRLHDQGPAFPPKSDRNKKGAPTEKADVVGAAGGAASALASLPQAAGSAIKFRNDTLAAARDATAQTIKEAGRKATADAAAKTAGDVAKYTKLAAAGGKGASVYSKRMAKGAERGLAAIKQGIADAGRQARVAAQNAELPKLADTARRLPAATAKHFGANLLKNNVATSFAVGGATSAVKGASDLASTYAATGGEGLGAAIKDTFTTKRGWSNLGKGLVGALRDVGNSMSFGLIQNGDKVRETMQDAKGGRTLRSDEGGGDASPAPAPSGGAPANRGGPRIVINPKVFSDRRDAMCVAFNERFRIWMEGTGYRPRSEPTRRQREFFSDTAYAEDETMLRRTILARIATLDTSVKDPTEAQVSDTLAMLRGFRETERPDDAWQAEALDRIIGYVEGLVPPSAQSAEPPSPEPSA